MDGWSGGNLTGVARLRRVDCSDPGIRRRRRGRGFEYLDERTGARVDDRDTVERIRALAIPPAWREVWICPHPMGHLQATGVDAAGRKQYRYHDRWRARRDQRKFDEMIDFARSLPRMRGVVDEHVRREQLDRERVLACAVRLLDAGFFRIGSEGYAAENGTYGLATMRKEHVTLGPGADALTFDYVAKGGKRRVQAIVDPEVREVVARLKRRRGGLPELLAYRRAGAWVDVRSSDINEYVREVTGRECSAKDFRTWNATVLAAVALAVSAEQATGSKTARKRAETRAVKEVAHYLGNTPAVCRASYIDPRVFDRYHSGWTVAGVLPDLGDLADPEVRETVESAVIDLLEDPREGDGVEHVDDEPLAA